MEQRIPRKPPAPSAPANNASHRTGTEKTEHYNNKHNGKHGDKKGRPQSSGENQKENVVFLARNQKHADRHAIRAALETDDLPGKLKLALGGLKLELDFQGSFVVREGAGAKGRPNYGQVKRILHRQNLPGWLEWLQVCNTDSMQ